MHCYVYASQRKADAFVWLREKDGYHVLPDSLAVLLGDLRFVLELELHIGRRLPQEDSATVMANLVAQGWHLQLPAQQMLATAPAASHPPVATADPEDTID